MEISQASVSNAREEAAVQAGSAELHMEQSVWDLAFAQILFIVGLQWVGVAAKEGPSHVIFWLIAVALFYLPSALVAVCLTRTLPLEGGLYLWAKLGFNEFGGFDAPARSTRPWRRRQGRRDRCQREGFEQRHADEGADDGQRS